MIKETIKDLKLWKLLLFPFIVYIIRAIVIMSFLDLEVGNLPNYSPEGVGLPPNVDYFFSATTFAMTILMLLFTKILFVKSSVGNYITKGLTISLLFILQFVILDIIIEIIIYNRTIWEYIRIVFIDYSPVIFIPIFTGIILNKEYIKIKSKSN